jgi:hypothetical protein
MKKKGLMQEELFLILAIGVIVIGIIIFIAVNFFEDLTEKEGIISDESFEQIIKSAIKISSVKNYGSIKLKSFNVHPRYDKVCFTSSKNDNLMLVDLINQSKIIDDAYKNNNNVFLIGSSFFHTFRVEKLGLVENFFCIPVTKKKINLKLHTKADKTCVEEIITNDCETTSNDNGFNYIVNIDNSELNYSINSNQTSLTNESNITTVDNTKFSMPCFYSCDQNLGLPDELCSTNIIPSIVQSDHSPVVSGYNVVNSKTFPLNSDFMFNGWLLINYDMGINADRITIKDNFGDIVFDTGCVSGKGNIKVKVAENARSLTFKTTSNCGEDPGIDISYWIAKVNCLTE